MALRYRRGLAGVPELIGSLTAKEESDQENNCKEEYEQSDDCVAPCDLRQIDDDARQVSLHLVVHVSFSLRLSKYITELTHVYSKEIMVQNL